VPNGDALSALNGELTDEDVQVPVQINPVRIISLAIVVVTAGAFAVWLPVSLPTLKAVPVVGEPSAVVVAFEISHAMIAIVLVELAIETVNVHELVPVAVPTAHCILLGVCTGVTTLDKVAGHPPVPVTVLSVTVLNSWPKTAMMSPLAWGLKVQAMEDTPVFEAEHEACTAGVVAAVPAPNPALPPTPAFPPIPCAKANEHSNMISNGLFIMVSNTALKQ
jgi:hypothetical protein